MMCGANERDSVKMESANTMIFQINGLYRNVNFNRFKFDNC
jgi:hypothetical protein